MWVSFSQRPSHSATAACAASLGEELAPPGLGLPPEGGGLVVSGFAVRSPDGCGEAPGSVAVEPGSLCVGGRASTLLRCGSTGVFPTPGARGAGVREVPGRAGAGEPAARPLGAVTPAGAPLEPADPPPPEEPPPPELWAKQLPANTIRKATIAIRMENSALYFSDERESGATTVIMLGRSGNKEPAL